MISPADWQRLKDLFAQATGIEGVERDRFVEAACKSNPDLKDRLMRLLSTHECATGFLSVPAVVFSREGQRRVLAPGQALCDRYVISSLIARGGMGDVYEAEDRVLGEKVALKAIWPDAASGRALEQIKGEVQSARRVTHASICRTYDIALHNDPPVALLTMQLLEGPTLSAYLREHGDFSRGEAYPVIAEICAGLQAAHDAGVIHRDFKPGNIILTGSPGQWHPVITDFGLALPSGMGAEQVQVQGGTPGYMAPEQARGGAVTPATDVYALGLVIARMTGALQFTGPMETPSARLVPPQGALDARRLGLWRRIISRCLEPDPARRFQRPADVAAALGKSQWRRRHAGILIGVAVFLILCLSVLLFRQSKPTKLSVPFQSRDLILVAAPENRTGEAVFDGTLAFALEQELSNSPFVNVVLRERVDDVLRLMKKPPGSTIDPALAVEICRRDGAIRALLDSRIEKIGSAYLLSVWLVDPSTGITVAARNARAGRTDQVLPAVLELCDWTRKALGEALPLTRPAGKRLEQVTTPSWQALQLYSRADEMLRGSQQAPAAEELLKQALKDDPDFASAEILLAWSIHRQGKRGEEALHNAQRALELSDQCGDREKYFIEGSYYSLTGQYDKAAAAYRALLGIDPEHYWAMNNLLAAYNHIYRGANREIVTVYKMRADVRPYSFADQMDAVRLSLFLDDDWPQADHYARRGKEVMSGAQQELEYVFSYEFRRLWQHDQLQDLALELDRIKKILSDPRTLTTMGTVAEASVFNVGLWHLALGQFKAAEDWFRKVSVSNDVLDYLLFRLALAKEDEEGQKFHAARLEGIYLRPDFKWVGGRPLLALMFARMGMIPAARRFLPGIGKAEPVYGSQLAKCIQAEIALANGEALRAKPLLEEALREIRRHHQNLFLLASGTLARLLADEGKLTEAIVVLEDAAGEKDRNDRVFGIQIQEQLALLYRRAGRSADAGRVESQLRKLLVCADPDHPILRRLRIITKLQKPLGSNSDDRVPTFVPTVGQGQALRLN